MFFDDWADPVRVVVVGTGTYLPFLVLLRNSGKRRAGQVRSGEVAAVALGTDGSLSVPTRPLADLERADGGRTA